MINRNRRDRNDIPAQLKKGILMKENIFLPALIMKFSVISLSSMETRSKLTKDCN
jgi:hypothetical protein